MQPAIAPFRRHLCKWPLPYTNDNVITYQVISSPPKISLISFQKAAQEAFSRWEAVTNIKAKFIEANSSKPANIIMQYRRLDGVSNVLADSELPCNIRSMSESLNQRYDIENWVIDDTPESPNIDLVRVIAHELGHALGMDHLNGNGTSLMDPVYSPNISHPQSKDIEEMQKRYGPPSPQTPIPPIPPKPPIPFPPEDPLQPKLYTATIMVTSTQPIDIKIPGYIIKKPGP